MHDEVSQSLASLLFLVENLIKKEVNDKKIERLKLIKSEINNSLNNIRNIAVNLRPPLIEEHGIVEAIEKYIEEYREKFKIEVKFSTNVKNLNNDNFNITLYRIIQECLSNIKKHAIANKVEITLYENEDYIVLSIADNGKGLSYQRIEDSKKEGRLGIYGIKERVLDFEGYFLIESDEIYNTIIRCRFKKYRIKIRENNNENFVNR